MDELQSLFKRFNFDRNKYFYHITSINVLESIINNVLGLYEKDIRSTMIEITENDVFS